MKRTNFAYNQMPNIKEVKNRAEQKYIITILNTTNWCISEAAQLMGINRSTLFRKMKRYGIKRPKIKKFPFYSGNKSR
jgi:transcriptional regulator of acetoin/glycerol metabolism|uniref:DNA binding HTH domain-containing protein n=1 Tax=candidate division WOR-3 bacterium TaxID=2052148 RepID=A0A7V3VTF9_UNCW3